MSDHNSCIYQIENTVNGKIYVGQTKDYHDRVLSHISSLKRGCAANMHLQRAWDKYGEDAFQFSVLEYCDTANLNQREIYWIQEKDSFHSGYNMTLGGGGIRGHQASEETKQKISAALSGRIVSEETKQKMRENHADFSGANHPNYGVKWADHVSPEGQASMREKMSARMSGKGNPNYGKVYTKEEIAQRMETRARNYAINGHPLTGRKYPERSGANAVGAVPVRCLNTLEYFGCAKDAAKAYSTSPASIIQCYNHQTKRAATGKNGEKLVWVRESEYQTMSEADVANAIEAAKPMQYVRKVRCITTGEEFESMKAACDTYHLDPSSLSAVCGERKRGHSCGKHPVTGAQLYWEYIINNRNDVT